MTRSLDDHSLVEACRAGQSEAFGALVQRYQERLYQTLLHLSGSAEDARDILQDTFLALTRSSTSSKEIARSIHGFTGSASILLSADIGDGARGRRSAGSTNTARIGVRMQQTTLPMPTRPTLWSGPNASKSWRLPSDRLAQNTGRWLS